MDAQDKGGDEVDKSVNKDTSGLFHWLWMRDEGLTLHGYKCFGVNDLHARLIVNN